VVRGDPHPTAEWLARQITEAFPWDSAPKYLIRGNDRAFGVAFKARVRSSRLRESLYVPARTPSNCHHITFEQAQQAYRPVLGPCYALNFVFEEPQQEYGPVPSRRHIVGTICATRDDLEVA
jgi:hypothetical protein